MVQGFSKLEWAVIEEIVSWNSSTFPTLKYHLPNLKIKSREFTGVGIFLNFEYLGNGGMYLTTKDVDLTLTSPKRLMVDNLEHELNYELNVTKGKFDFLEIVSNVEAWDGNFKFFNFKD